MLLPTSLQAKASAKQNHPPTPRQTEGPFFPRNPQRDRDADLTQIVGKSQRAKGEVIEVSGRVFSTEGKPLSGVSMDVWQANTWGRYAHQSDRSSAPLDANFQGWAQLMTDERGFYRFKTIKPGAYAVSRNWQRPPHIHFKLSKRGFRSLTTQMYFAGDPLNDIDGILLQHTADERRSLIVDFDNVAARGKPASPRAGEFNIYLDRVG